jgi:HisA/HisF family protein
MKLIPVVDLMQGQVVRAVRGDRAAYRPIVSQLCAGSDPVTVATAMCKHCAQGQPHQQLYIADLDALLGRPAQVAVLRTILHALPDLELWLDAGFASAASASALLTDLGRDGERVVPVFGSESLASRTALAECFGGESNAAQRVLSLDRRNGQRLDAAGCWDAPALWPKRVIVMTLERVGSDAGPDLDTIIDVQRKAPVAFIVGAGGIRDEADLARARDAGAGAWLVASALHDGRLPRMRA